MLSQTGDHCSVAEQTALILRSSEIKPLLPKIFYLIFECELSDKTGERGMFMFPIIFRGEIGKVFQLSFFDLSKSGEFDIKYFGYEAVTIKSKIWMPVEDRPVTFRL